MILYLIILCLILSFSIVLFMKHPQFGAKSKGERLLKMQHATNFKNGIFQNINKTPSIAEGYNVLQVLRSFFFTSSIDAKPQQPIPNKITNLLALDKSQDQFIWFGHSSYLIILNGKTFLIDPVFSGNASPIKGSVKAFNGSNTYEVAHLPNIDYLIITHDHFDHLDYITIKNLRSKVNTVICPLGVGAHFEKWGYDDKQLIEKNWWETEVLANDIEIHFTPARHFSGRTFKRNTTLWTSYVLKTEKLSIFIGGDSGYDTHFKTIGQKFGPFDWAILENGQYNKMWKYIHTLPEEQIQVVQDLKAKKVIAVHNSKFKLANHAWYEPLEALKNNCSKANIILATPIIGDILLLHDDNPPSEAWWK